jgi:hypothetical protein
MRSTRPGNETDPHLRPLFWFCVCLALGWVLVYSFGRPW